MNVIAVDDEKLALDTITDSIGKVAPEANVHGFRNAREAVGFVRNNYCEIAFMDVRMRGGSGLELARQLKDIQPDINIVFVTGYSEYALDAFRLYASDYLLKPATPQAVASALAHLRTPIKPVPEKKIRFQCFGAFGVFFGDKTLIFKRAKAKELLAYLVDRMGASVTMGELMSVLWEDGQDTPSRRSNLRNLISDARCTLAEADSANIIVKGRNTIALDCNAFDCDYYDFLRHIPYAVNSYRGEYMTQYSWAEITTASLFKNN
ncbi:MAG: response regulator [Candidatus Coproplasma sp.]